MPTKIKVDALSAESLEKAASRVRKLQRAYVNANREFVKRLTARGITVMSENLYGRGDTEPPEISTPHVMMGLRDGIVSATLRLRGEDVMFVEFGAGITYNGPAGSSPHPLGVELGYTIGSYGKGNGRKEYWFYDEVDEEGDVHTQVSYGTEATMPMWKADQAIKNEFASIAKQVFGNLTGV